MVSYYEKQSIIIKDLFCSLIAKVESISGCCASFLIDDLVQEMKTMDKEEKQFADTFIKFINLQLDLNDSGPYREHTCWKCGVQWMVKVQMSNSTHNLSGEKTEYCPKCNVRSNMASPWINKDKTPYYFDK